MRTKLLTLFAVLGLMLSQGILAQSKTVTGTVTDASTNETMPGVNVVVKNTTVGTMTQANGTYSLSASPGDILVFTFVGYSPLEATVGSSNRINASLSLAATELGEVVVTAEFGMKRVSRAVGSSIQNINASEIAVSGRDNFITALQGRVAGMNVGSTSGAPGSSTTVILRSITSISGNNQPLYIVDGIPMNNSTFDPRGLADGAQTYGLSSRDTDFGSRGNDLNPEDIESMTVLKGAAAASLYGSDASNGAIIITTKKGSVSKGKINYSNSFRWDDAYGYPDVQTKYANGIYGTTNYYYTSRYGGPYIPGTLFYDNIGSILQTGFTQKHNISAEGGTDRVTIRAGASVLDQNGVIKTTSYSRLNLSLSGTAVVTDWFRIESSLAYTNTDNNKVQIGTAGPLAKAMLWPIVDDMSQWLAEDGMHMSAPDFYIDADLLNPIFAMHKNKFYDTSDRFLSMVAATFTPIKNTFFKAQVGWDVGTQTFITSVHPYYTAYQTGTGHYNIANSNFSDPTMNLLAGYTNSFLNEKLSVSAQAGYHQLENGVTRIATTGSKYAVYDFQSINNCDPLTVASTQRTTKRRIQALSARVELGYNNMAYITLSGRNDWSSTLPPENNRYFYPAIEGSFVVTELPFMSDIKAVNYLKLRGAIAQVGKDAGPLEIDPQLEPTYLWGGGYKYGYTGPNKNLVPEMNTSKEVGFEGRFINNRLNTDFTYFWTTCDNQIVKEFRLSYGTGFVLNTMNVGTFETWGWEAHVDGDIIQMARGLRWNVGINASHTGSEVTFLPANVSEYYNAYTWNINNIRNGVQVGYPVTSITALTYLRNNAGDLLISPTSGLPITGSVWTNVGDREPKLRFGITTSLSYKGLYLSAMFSGRYKATVVNGTKWNMMANGLSWESVDLRESGTVIFDGVLQDGNENSANPTKNNIIVDQTITPYTGSNEDWIEEDVHYLRLQELRLNYNLPAKWLERTPLSQANVFICGNDLFVWTNYSGIDAVGNAVSAAAGGSGGEGMDIWSLPNPRGYSMGLNVTFNR
jgi:TonB-linked SusC/RagA family outer membrane protein